MAHIPSHHSGADEAHNTFLVVFKVHGGAIHLWSQDKTHQNVSKASSFKITCHNVETHSANPCSDIQVFVLSDPAPMLDKCTFRDQDLDGELITVSDVACFMTKPVDRSREASYAIDIALVNHGNPEIQSECGSNNNERQIGSAYVYLDPKFSSQGIQRTPIVAAGNRLPIGQIQIEYLIVTNPVAYGLQADKAEWLCDGRQLHAGHRGSGSGRRMDLPEELLENSIESFNYAHRHGADMCELDVSVSAEGVPIVYHDFLVDAVTAHQSSDELGRFRVQVNEFTVKQLRNFRLLALHDGEGCPYTLNVPNQAESNKPFPTLAEVLEQVTDTCGFNIEIKWPQMLENGSMEARKYREINDFIDRIIAVVDKHAGNRRVVLESFDADLVIMLRLKQNRFPVFFLTQGMTDQYERYMDIRARSVRNGIYFAQAFNLAGIDLILDYYIASGKELVNFISDHDLIARAWGDIGESGEKLRYLRQMGLQCITYDKIDLVRKAIDINDHDLENLGSHDEEDCLSGHQQAIEQQVLRHLPDVRPKDPGGNPDLINDILEIKQRAIVA